MTITTTRTTAAIWMGIWNERGRGEGGDRKGGKIQRATGLEMCPDLSQAQVCFYLFFLFILFLYLFIELIFYFIFRHLVMAMTNGRGLP